LPPLTLDSPIDAIDRQLASRRVGYTERGPEARVVLERALGITTVGQLLHHYPRRYIDRSRVQRISKLELGVPATVIATVKGVKLFRPQRKPKMSIVTVTIKDSSGTLPLTFFNQHWLARTYSAGQELAAYGVPHLYKGKLQLANLEVEILRGGDQDLIHTGRITPVHPAAEGIYPKTIRALLHRALQKLPRLKDPLPPDMVAAEGLPDYDSAIRHIHFPEDDGELDAARERLKFDELFTLELGVAFRRQRAQAERKGVVHEPDGPLTTELLANLPFEPTRPQRVAISSIAEAMAGPSPMNILLQGDVGSGKTLVALHACLVAVQSGHQAAIMAPTEVLAGQHFRSVATLLEPIGGSAFTGGSRGAPGRQAASQASLFGQGAPAPPSPEPQGGPVFALLTGAVTGKERQAALAAIADGGVDIVIGTHALVQEAVEFADLSLAVVDEQHRFGLHQRTALKGKGGGDIDVLIMTATPIPRTLALTYYGDLDVVVIDEMPSGRRPIRTVAARAAEERAAAEEVVRSEVASGRQAYVVCAAIDEQNRTQVKAAEAEAERLRSSVFPDLKVELLHGRMRPKDKERIMDAFRAGDADVLISTTVIEVGVDVPNATVMLVENAERFGLAQLHQLRGRIGRGEHPSTCVLFDESSPDNLEARARIDAMVASTDGFVLADEDLRLRGEGTLFDARQSGMPDLKLVRLAEDLDLVRRARERAFAMIGSDPGLEGHPDLLDELRRRFESSIDWLFRS
jgi:ATP-dependent DNA helicase RecG